MKAFPLALLVGIATGFLGAIPPGPLNITVLRKVSERKLREALRVSLGGAIVGALICAAIGLGLGWALERLLNDPWVRLVLAVFLIVYGIRILVLGRIRGEAEAAAATPGAAPPASKDRPHGLHLLVGFLQGAANPALLVNWTLVTGFLVSHRVVQGGAGPMAGFALGVGLGVFLWFLVLIELVDRLKDHPAGEWSRGSHVLAGLLLAGFGLFFLWRSAAELAGRFTIGA
ncbi:hypothetical protein FBQ97_04910 [Acidobacteria bacterium ACD]|nr:hypothetical protein [Acidobacteria bacterium ACD]